MKVFQQAIISGLQHKENPSDDYLSMALELLGE
jgi:Rab-like protein 2